MTETTYTNLRQSLASVLDRVANDHEVVIVSRRGRKRVAMVPADELAGLWKPRTCCDRLEMPSDCCVRYDGRPDRKGKPEPLDKLRREMGLAAER